MTFELVAYEAKARFSHISLGMKFVNLLEAGGVLVEI